MHHNAGCHPPPYSRSHSRRSILHTCCWRQKFSVHFSGIEPMPTYEPSEIIGFRSLVKQAQVYSVVFICITRKVRDNQAGKQQMFIDEMREKYLFIVQLLLNNGSHRLYTLQWVRRPTTAAPLYTAPLPPH